MMSHQQLSKILLAVIVGLGGLLLSQSDALLSVIAPETPEGQHRVVRVSDGDTIVVDMNGTEERIRLIGVDTPETQHPSQPVQCFGRAATEYTTQNVGTFVRLEADPLSSNRDRYGRLLRYVYNNDQLINYRLIADGYGFAYRTYPHTELKSFIAAEHEAREHQRGLWAGCDIEINENGSYEVPSAE